MNRITRRTLLGGLTAVGAGTTLLPQASHANVLAGAAGARTSVAALQPLQTPPNVNVIVDNGGTAPGLLFLTVQGFAAPNAARGPQLVDNQGQTVWFRSISPGTFAADFRVQTYQNQQVLTWWEGTVTTGGIGLGSGYIANANYDVIATVGEGLDLHEFRLTDAGTALVIVFQEVAADLTGVGGPSNGTAWDSTVQELDLATGEPVFEWRSIDHVPVEESVIPYPGSGAYDYIHVNSVDFDVDGNLLITGRHTNSVYKVDRTTGEVLFRLGGANSTFEMGEGSVFVGHHDGQAEGGNVYRIFDNATQTTMGGEVIGPMQGEESRVLWVEVDEAAGTASLVNEIYHPDGLLAIAEGGTERLPNDNVLTSWGQGSHITEHSPTNELLFDAQLDQGMSSYRAYRMEWQGQPCCPPEVALDEAGNVHAVWNGATNVAAWRVLGGSSDAGLTAVAQTAWKGMNTAVPLAESVRRDVGYIRVQALDKRGKVLGTSRVTALARETAR